MGDSSIPQAGRAAPGKDASGRDLELLLAHGEGEIGRVVVGGADWVPGASAAERLAWFNNTSEGRNFRRRLVLEPRGFAQMSTNIVLPPFSGEADFSIFVLQPDKAHAVSGSNTIATVTALLETGRLDPKERLLMETALGVFPVFPDFHAGRCRSVRVEVAGAYAEALDVPLSVPDLGEVVVDIAFGGVFILLVRPERFGLTIESGQAHKLVRAAGPILRAAQERFHPVHPRAPALNGISYLFYMSETPSGDLLGANVMPPGRLDRSPCGTGNMARLAALAARGGLEVGDRFTAYSPIGSHVTAECLGLQDETGAPSLSVSLRGRGWLYGRTTLFAEVPDDLFPLGLAVSDLWGEGWVG